MMPLAQLNELSGLLSVEQKDELSWEVSVAHPSRFGR